MLRPIITTLALAALGSVLFGCDSKDPNTASTDTSSTKTDATAPPVTPAVNNPDSGPLKSTDSSGKKFTYTEPKVQKGDIAVVETSMGTIKFELTGEAPGHIANFEKLADAHFYDGTGFHRVIPGFMIQGGDPNTRDAKTGAFGAGDPGYKIKGEFNTTPFDRGIVGMARSQDPDSAGSQFFIMVASNPGLNGQYTAFGKVTEGMEVADKIVAVPTNGDQVKDIDQVRIKSVKIVHPGAK